MGGKYIEEALVISQERIAEDIYSMWIASGNIAKSAAAGQFALLYTDDGSRLLPRPLSFCEIDEGKGALRIVYRVTGRNTGTEGFSRLKAGDIVKITGPLGNGFPLNKAAGKKAMLIGGGIGVIPLLEPAKRLTGEKILVMGYKGTQYLSKEFKAAGKYFAATEDGSAGTKGNVMDAIRENGLSGDIIFACGPKPMLRAVKQHALKSGIPCYISMEERMACGIGACLGCVCRSKDVDAHSMAHYKRVCKDGPVFLSTEVEL